MKIRCNYWFLLTILNLGVLVSAIFQSIGKPHKCSEPMDEWDAFLISVFLLSYWVLGRLSRFKIKNKI